MGNWNCETYFWSLSGKKNFSTYFPCLIVKSILIGCWILNSQSECLKNLSSIKFPREISLRIGACLDKANNVSPSVLQFRLICKYQTSVLLDNAESLYLCTYVRIMQCDQIGRFIGLWATFQSLRPQIICPNLLYS